MCGKKYFRIQLLRINYIFFQKKIDSSKLWYKFWNIFFYLKIELKVITIIINNLINQSIINNNG
jgi:hypothetical protein